MDDRQLKSAVLPEWEQDGVRVETGRQPRPAVSVIIPTRNEAENVEPLLQRLAAATSQLPIEVLFVDDSDDNTPQRIRAISGHFPFPVGLIARPPERRDGLSGAVVAGLRAAAGEWACVIDADLQHPPEVIPRLWARATETGADMVVGSRAGDGMGPSGLSRRRALTSQALTILARMLFPRRLKNVSDPLTGLFLVRREAVDANLLRPDGFKILLEILIRCPEMRVSEIHFDFGQRHGGESKADLHEGMRFLRHLLRLRLTATRWFRRYVAVRTLGLLVNMVSLVAMTTGAGLFYLLSAVLATELTVLWNFFWTEHWVFTGGEVNERRLRFSRFALINQLFLLLRLPVIYLLVTKGGVHYAVATLLAIFAVGLVKYGASEQWIWNKGLSWQRRTFRYDIHGIIAIESQVRLPELAYFETAEPLPHADIQIRLDRHGTPNCQPGAICYDEGLSRFGFGLAIMPGECTEVVVSPVLENAPYVLYQSILEPLLRWTFARKGCALVHAACVSRRGQAVLIAPEDEGGKTMMVLQAIADDEWAFVSDDLTIIAGDGRVKSYPKPLTVSRPLLQAVNTATLTRRERLQLPIQNLVYLRSGRRVGLWFSERRWPVATLNILVQRLAPPPKYMVERLAPGVRYADTAVLSSMIIVEKGADSAEPLTRAQAAQVLIRKGNEAGGFPPYGLLMEQMSQWRGQDLRETERATIEAALSACALQRDSGSYDGRWQLSLSML